MLKFLISDEMVLATSSQYTLFEKLIMVSLARHTVCLWRMIYTFLVLKCDFRPLHGMISYSGDDNEKWRFIITGNAQ